MGPMIVGWRRIIKSENEKRKKRGEKIITPRQAEKLHNAVLGSYLPPLRKKRT